jgi:hypothetical protein
MFDTQEMFAILRLISIIHEVEDGKRAMSDDNLVMLLNPLSR